MWCNFSQGEVNKRLFITDRAPRTDHGKDFTRVQLREAASLLWELLGVWMPQGLLHHCTTITMGKDSTSYAPGASYWTCRWRCPGNCFLYKLRGGRRCVTFRNVLSLENHLLPHYFLSLKTSPIPKLKFSVRGNNYTTVTVS